jgi:hypothetical protein
MEWINHYGLRKENVQLCCSSLKGDHTFTAAPAGLGLHLPCNKILALKPPTVLLHRNNDLRVELIAIRTMLYEFVVSPMACQELVGCWPHVVGYTDTSRQGYGGIIVGEHSDLLPPDVIAQLVS